VSGPKARPGAVQVPRGVLLGLLGALAAAVLLVAFLMGRESARTPSPPVAAAALPQPLPAVPPPAEAPATVAGFSPWPAQAEPAEARPAAPPEGAPSGAAQVVAAPSEGASLGQPAAATSDRLRDDVARYFREVEAIQAQAKTSGDPETFARTLLEQGVKGDESGFDGLTAANKKVLDSLRSVSVPDPCREHHRQTLALLEESIGMIDGIRRQLQGGSEASLTAFATRGKELESKAKEVDALAAEIKRRYGL